MSEEEPFVGKWPAAEEHAVTGGPVREVCPDGGEQDDVDRNTVSVHLTLPQYQREGWDDHAEELDMSRAEFVRAMVQAGRRGFEDTTAPAAGADVRGRLLDALDGGGAVLWNELVEHVVDDIEADLEDELQSLIEQDRVEHSPREGTYRLDDGPP